MEEEYLISTDSSLNSVKINEATILYLNNPDKVYFSELDDVIKHNLEEKGLSVIKADLQEINFEIKSNQIDLFINNQKTQIDGFLAYGYMSSFHYEAFLYIIETFDSMGIPCLHNAQVEKILSNKYLQALKFSKAKIPIPPTFQGYSVEGYKSISSRNFQNQFAMFKKLDDYGGDGVKRCETKELLVNMASKTLWKNEYCLFQNYVPDSEGKSIRVLCINNKAIAIAEYIDKSNNYISNCSYGEFFELKSLMNIPNYSEYALLGERASESIGDLLISGVDILDSKNYGLVVLEVNGFPDIFDISHSTKLDIFSIFAGAYKEKVKKENCKNSK